MIQLLATVHGSFVTLNFNTRMIHRCYKRKYSKMLQTNSHSLIVWGLGYAKVHDDCNYQTGFDHLG